MVGRGVIVSAVISADVALMCVATIDVGVLATGRWPGLVVVVAAGIDVGVRVGATVGVLVGVSAMPATTATGG